MSRKVSVLGAGGHAKVVISTLLAQGDEVVAAFDDEESLWGQTVLGVPVKGPVSEVKGSAVIAIGSNQVRAELSKLELEWVSAIHPTAWVDPSARIGVGTVIFAHAAVQPDVVIGNHVIVNTSASADHDCQLGDFSHLAPGAHLGGGVSLREGAWVGLGASVLQGLQIGAWAVVGAGAVVLATIPGEETHVGNPSRKLR